MAIQAECESYFQGRNLGGKDDTVPRSPNHCDGAEKSQNVTSTSFSTVNLRPKELRFEQVGATLASCPGRHLTSLRPWLFPS